ncbi:RsmB/NOP family class I SAM-dependent RNA methyltransferase [Formicincola oecophyllae]|uniref:RsmB/NOP family class I SAM-dependent RNA methyltransferase n=1 Tax=Formicincola oecophyllae TaxID=2558361 RepID=A0A4Y6UB99_9PROT|nr:RsmB/NOP family class I SAM-dependent RNA methyltransferase [Formicincola oecophyllae]QDH13737.1 RsmB/NOP family class I SAM-dependent RNA methyltransferase [Formicincola oecophyllae]
MASTRTPRPTHRLPAHGSGAPHHHGQRTPADPVRDLAFDIVTGVVEHRRMLETTLDKLRQGAPMEGRDRAAAHRLAAGALRHRGSIEEILKAFLHKEPPVPVRCALMLGVAQLLYLDVPPHAAVGTVVDLMRRRGLAPFAGLANAVLRRVAREGARVRNSLDEARLDVPAWLWSAWGERARPITEGFYKEAPLDLTLRPGAPVPEGGTQLPTGSVRMTPGTRMTEIPGFEGGQFWAQDAAAAMPVRLLGDVKGLHVADLCAAPGGKTAQLALAGATVTAIEREEGRLARLRENLERLGLENVAVHNADANAWRPETPLDAVLLDAPCSATGTLRRHPDVVWTKRPADIATLTEGQDNLIDAARAMLKPGGTLLYAVCSLQDEEGPERVKAALARGGWSLKPFTVEELAALPEARTEEGFYRTHPGMWADKGGMDGFFAARLVREG